MLRKLLIVTVFVVLVGVAAVFATNNPDPVDVDVGLTRFEDVSMTLVLACAFAFGWLFGVASVGFAILKMSAERRRIRRELKDAEHEVASLRSLPMNDAD